MKYIDDLVNWIRKEVKKANALGVIVGISGGVDSALVGYLAKKSFPNNSLGILIPINSDCNLDLKDGLELVNKIELKHQIVNLENEYREIKTKLDIDSNLINGNIQSRLRMLTIYAYAQKNNYLVLGTDNKAEYDLGYFTKYGDGGCDLLPIVRLHKSEVYNYAKLINVPDNIISKKPSAGFWWDQCDENELGFTYDDYELYCKKNLKDGEIVKKIERQILKTNHKRKQIPKPPQRR